MALNIKAQTKSNDEILLVSRFDTAIDWDNSFLNMLMIEEKVVAYEEDYDHSKLKFFEGETPTFFVFQNPKLTVHQAKIRSVLIGIQAAIGRGEPTDSDTLIWNTLAVGTRESGNTDEFARNKKKELTNEVLQGLEDAEVLRELGAFMFALSFKQNAKVTNNHAQKK